MVLRPFLYYYYANQVMVLVLQFRLVRRLSSKLNTFQGANLTEEVWNVDWFDESKDVKYMVQFFNMRAQKPLQYFVGSFEVMNLQSFISVCTCPSLILTDFFYLSVTDFKGGVLLCYATTHSSIIPPAFTLYAILQCHGSRGLWRVL